MPVWARLVVAASALRVAVALAFWLAGIYNAGLAAPLAPAVYAALIVSFGALGLLLFVAARNDVRAAWLGGVLLLIAVPLTSRFLSQTEFALGTVLTRIQPGAFLPAFLWRFASEFPSPLESRAGRYARLAAAAAAVFGAAAFAVNLSIAIWPVPTASLGWRAWLATGQVASSSYWPALFLLSSTAALALALRMLRSAGDERIRVRIFVGALVLGLLPMFVEIAIEELWPSYAAFVHRPAIEPWIAVMLFGPLALVPVVTAYSVLYDRVVDTRLVIRSAIQYALARYTIGAATAVPFAALVFYLFHHRTEPLARLMSGPRPVILAAAVAAGVLSLRGRRSILRAIDRRFFREVYDAHLLVTTLMSDRLMGGTPAEIADGLRTHVDRALHARADLYVLDDEGVWFRDPGGQRRPLDARALLVSLAMADSQPMDLRVNRGSPLARLPEAERAWMAEGGYELVMAIRSRGGEPAGLLALTRKRSELPFSPTDRRSIGALAAPLGLAIENERLRRGPESDTTQTARECEACARLHSAAADRCSCGGATRDAAVPYVLRGVFQFDRRIGAGGMGIVYRALDLNLKRDVAIKTLPRLTSEAAAQLKHEARAMASLNHTHLAAIYGIEWWRGTPFLIEEYLAGGMLADRLRGGPLPLTQTLELGADLAVVVGQLHAAGIVHCDIKPSNIGFSQTGVVKLVDFGVAHMLRSAASVVTSAPTETGDAATGLSALVTGHRLFGTPAYMSPEAALGAPPSPGWDLWSLSAVLFESFAGSRPFDVGSAADLVLQVSRRSGRAIRELRPDCPEEVASFFEAALSADPARRPRDAADLKRRLSALQLSLT